MGGQLCVRSVRVVLEDRFWRLGETGAGDLEGYGVFAGLLRG